MRHMDLAQVKLVGIRQELQQTQRFRSLLAYLLIGAAFRTDRIPIELHRSILELPGVPS